MTTDVGMNAISVEGDMTKQRVRGHRGYTKRPTNRRGRPVSSEAEEWLRMNQRAARPAFLPSEPRKQRVSGEWQYFMTRRH